MKKNYFLAAWTAAFLACGAFTACSEDDPITGVVRHLPRRHSPAM